MDSEPTTAEVVPLLLERLGSEPDEGVRAAFASALGALGAEAAVPQLLSFLQECQDEDTRMELALALARIIGNEHRFVQLWRQMRAEPGTAASRVIASLKRRLRRWAGHRPGDPGALSAIDRCAEAFARGDLERGAGLMASFIPLLLESGPSAGSRAGPSTGSRAGPVGTSATILQECARRLDQFGAGRSEYVLLALHVLAEGW